MEKYVGLRASVYPNIYNGVWAESLQCRYYPLCIDYRYVTNKLCSTVVITGMCRDIFLIFGATVDQKESYVVPMEFSARQLSTKVWEINQ